MMRMLGVVLLFSVASSALPTQRFDFPDRAIADDAALSKSMPALAEDAIAAYQDDDHDKYLDNLFRLQLVAGRYVDAERTLASLRELRLTAKQPIQSADVIRFQIYVRAKLWEHEKHQSFDEAYKQAFRAEFETLDDMTAYRAISQIGSPLNPYGAFLGAMQADLKTALDKQRGKTTIALPDALDLISKYQDVEAYKSFQALTDALVAEDDKRRYAFEDDIQVKTSDGATIAAMLMRPRTATRLPTLLVFNIYVYDNPSWKLGDLRLSAAHGYASVLAYTRGKGNSPDQPVPWEHDGADADAVIDWISKQSWSDGRVGMYGGSYSGFTQWAAAKHLPPALKALMPSAPGAPGIDTPMEGNVFENFVYQWPIWTTTNKTLDQRDYDDHARWNKLGSIWYSSGQAYRALEKIDGTPNPVFQRWLDHPSYDAYWQSMTAYKEDFAKIDIPVLTITGYYDGGQVSALYYFSEHNKYNAHADHYLLIGPYDHGGVQTTPAENLDGYEIDPAARIGIRQDLRYQWFDYVFRGAPKPELLKDRVNYEVMGENVWKHVASLDAMSAGHLRFHLSQRRSGEYYRLDEKQPVADAFIPQKIDLANRSDVDQGRQYDIIDKGIDTSNGLVFVSDPLTKQIEFSGLFSGQLDFVVNKRDMDINISMYEQMPDGRYFELSTYVARASYLRDRSQRELLVPGEREELAFKNGRLTSRLLRIGSRLVVVLSVVKNQYFQINYGTGKDVSDETIADAKEPLLIKWYCSSYLDVPI